MDPVTIDRWLRAAQDDAERRGLPELRPLLDTLARSTRNLREADLAARADADHRPEPPRG